jgi:hypothetical protein
MSATDGGGLRDRVQQCFAAYRAKERQQLEAMLAPEFTFSSPYDDRLMRLQYLERCWPDSERVEGRRVEKVVESGDEALVQYTCELNNGIRFCNFGRFVFKGDKVRAIEVYFGEAPAGEGIVSTPAPVSTA